MQAGTGILFLSTLSLRRATVMDNIIFMPREFLSTLSLRRATTALAVLLMCNLYFYPRSPCGERLPQYHILDATSGISIHALLAESDVVDTLILANAMLFLSTLSLRRATPTTRRHDKNNIFLSTLSLRRATTWARGSRVTYVISIHALLAESDSKSAQNSGALLRI